MAGGSFVFENAEEIKALFKEFPEVAMKSARFEMMKIGRDLVRTARAKHRFENQSNVLENSIDSRVSGTGTGDGSKAMLEFWADTPYARRIHYGWGSWNPDRYIEKPFMDMYEGKNGPSMGARIHTAIMKALKAKM